MYCSVRAKHRHRAYVDVGVQSNTRTLCIIPYRISHAVLYCYTVVSYYTFTLYYNVMVYQAVHTCHDMIHSSSAMYAFGSRRMRQIGCWKAQKQRDKTYIKLYMVADQLVESGCGHL